MDAPVYNLEGDELGRVDLPAEVFGIEPNRAVMHQALVRQLSNMRRGSHRTQNRSEVSRTGAKWFRQKGTGRARHGDRTANLFVGGAVAHGPKLRSYRKRMPRQMRRLAVRSALSVKARDGAVLIVQDMAMEEPRTRVVEDLVDMVCDGRTTLVVLAGQNENVERSIRNLPHVRYVRSSYLNVRDILDHEVLMFDVDALPAVADHLGAAGHDRAGEADDAQH
jgi:large subunit ribosomal protein L4